MLYIMDDSDKVLIAQKVSSEMYMHFDKVRFVSVAMNAIHFVSNDIFLQQSWIPSRKTNL